jgi:RHS repeat-associated protein
MIRRKKIIAMTGLATLILFISAAVMGTSKQTVTVKLAPSVVSLDTSSLPPKLADAEMEAVWRIFDDDTDTLYTPSQTAKITITYPEARAISRIRTYGASAYQLNLYRENNGVWEAVPSLSGADLSVLGSAWTSFAVTESFSAANFLLEFIPISGVTGGIREIEIWGPENSTGQESPSQVSLNNIATPQEALDIIAKNAAHILEFSAAPSEISVSQGTTPQVSIGITQNPVLFKRAYILYDGYNLVRSVSVQRRINSLSWSGGFSLPQAEDAEPTWSSYIEEINPAWLVQGENRIEFQVSEGSAAIRGLKLIAETDSGWNYVSSASPAETYDGDTATSYTIAAASVNPTLDVNFERNVQPETLRLHISGQLNLTAGLQYQNGTAWQDVQTGWQLDFSTLQSGWNEIAVPAAVSTKALRLTFNTLGKRIKPGVQIGKIDEIRVSAGPLGSTSGDPRIVIAYPRDGEYFNRTAYVQGFAVPTSNNSGAVQVGIEGKIFSNTDGSFSLSLSKDETTFFEQADDDAWSPVMTSQYGAEVVSSVTLTLNKNSGSKESTEPKSENRSNAPYADNRDKHTERVTPGEAKKIEYKGVTLEIPAGAVDKDTDITIIPLTEADLAHYNPGMINVTYPDAGYRFQPHGKKFKKAIKISFGYSKSLFASGQTDNDVNMYYYDESLLKWQQLTRVKADSATAKVTSESDHFTDIINSTLVVPEHAQALSFNPNSIKDIKAADPSANVNLIEPPTANNKGTANLSYPIEVPPGRNKLQPNIAVQYNSSGGNGWMGLGWDIPLQAITIDTRWGVPRYSTTQETETYMLDGEQLTPLAHRGELQPRTSEKVFHSRVEGQFRKIIRHGTAPSNYWWEVIDKSGTKYYYGGKPDSSNIPNSEATLADPSSKNIFKWALRRIQDANGNTINYTYTVVENTGIASGGTVMGYQLYLATIDYTGYNEEAGAYSVAFTRDRKPEESVKRPDVVIDARSGFKMVTADLLKRIEVKFTDDKGQIKSVRSYSFDYVTAAFEKTHLKNVVQYGSNNAFFNKHEFSYYDNVSQGNGTYSGFNSSTTWNTRSDDVKKEFVGGLVTVSASVLGGTEASNSGEMLYLGFAAALPTKNISIGGKVGTSSSDTTGLITMVDINGDNLPDKVYKCGDNVCYRLNTSGPGADLTQVSFSSEAGTISGISVISRDHSDQTSGGAQGFYGAGSAIYDDSTTMTTQSAYFTDANGDGLIDLVDNGTVYFNTGKVDSNNSLAFSTNSYDTPASVDQGIVDASGMIPDYSNLYNEMSEQNPLLDSVRRWVAPYDGTVNISGAAQLVDTTQERANNNYTTADGVRVAIQQEGTELWSATTSTSTDYSQLQPSGTGSVAVKRGEHIYFRLQSQSDGSYDQINWNPVIEYTDVQTSQTDVNSRPVYKYTASDDLIMGGREFPITMPYQGTLRITGNLSKKGVTTDDVAVVITLNDSEIRRSALTWDQTGTMTASGSDIDVQKDDVLKLKVLVDSNIDLKQLEWDTANKPEVFYVEAYYPDTTPLDSDGNSAVDSNGNPVGPTAGSPVTVKDDKGNYIVQLEPLYDMEFYPENTLTAPQEGWTATETGTILVTPYISASAQGTVFTVKRRTALLGKNVITTEGEAYDSTKHSFEVPVNAGEELFFDFSSRDAELAGNISGVSATAHYITTQNTTNLSNIGISLNGQTNQKNWSPSQEGIATITPFLSLPTGSVFNFDSSVTLNVVRGTLLGSTTYYSRTITIQKGYPVNPMSYAFDVAVTGEDTLTFYYTTTDGTLIGKPITSGAKIRLSPAVSIIDVPSALHSHVVPNVFSKPYRGWGYLAYNGNGDRATKAIDQSLLTASSSESDYDSGSSVPTEDTKDSYTAIQNYYVPRPDISQNKWTSVDESWWISVDQMSSTRMGVKYISVPTSDKYSGTTAPSRLTENSQSSLGAGYYVAYSDSDSPSKTVLDYMDLNGDRYPDVVGQGVVQYTDMLGALEASGTDLTQSIGSVAVRDSQADSDTIGPGGTAPDVSKWGKKPPQGQQSQNPSYGLSGSLGMGTSYTNCDMMDVNGDGLPDRVCDSSGSISVQLNLGYNFAQAESWGSAKLSNGSSTNLTLSPSLSYTDGVKGFSGGVSVAGAETTNEAALVDINGDGLLDRVYNSGNDIYVGFNKGGSFADPVRWEGSLGHRITEGLNASYYAGLSYYYPIGPLCLVACYIIINPETNYGESVSREESALRDVNGDGYADHLFSDSDGSLEVAVNRTENTNLLKTVKRPLGGSIEIKYARQGNTYDMPQSQWTMTEVTLTDGMKRTYRTSYEYSGGYQDRYERDFYGFKTVTETQAPDTAVTRKIVETYYISDYYLKGLLQKTVTKDAKTNVGYVWARTDNNYNKAAVKDDKGNAISDTYFPALDQTITSFYNGKGTDEDGRAKYTYQKFGYDDYGNVNTFNDYGEVDDGGADDITASITYHADLNKYIIKPETILVTHSSTMLRKRVATYDGNGNLKTLTLHNTKSPESVWTMEYDSAGYGNVTGITDPVGYKLAYAYDTTVHTYVTQISDNFTSGDGGPYYSSAGYNLYFGQVSSSVDLNKNTDARGYDQFGRLVCVYGPYDTAPVNPDDCGGTPTIAFAYAAPALSSSDNETINAPAVAETTNRAVSSKGGDPIKIRTLTYADGMKRILETKKDATVNGANGTVVSGMVTFDELGRVTEQGQPQFESGYNTAFTAQPTLRHPTLFTYDALDRTTMVVAPDGATTTTSYDFGKVNNTGVTYAMTTVVDPEGNAGGGTGRGTKISYKDVDDRIMAVVEYNKTKPYITAYGYNPLGEITSVKDNKSNTTYVEFDEVGNRLVINNPDSGKTTYNYDANGNILNKFTANNQKITYSYVYNRLMGIDYPNNLKTASVSYEYGKMGEAYNRAGRIKKVTDESGVEERQYGKLGEIMREEKTVEAKTPAVQKKKFSTDYVFDSFGRMTEMTYPDGEKLRYAYDNGGLLKAAWGEKSGNRYDYITSLLYDEFGQRTSIAYGNGAKTTYSYNEKTRRLATLNTTLKSGQQIQTLSYNYDLVGNIKGLLNDIKVATNTALPAGRVKQEYGYDDLYQITDAQGWYNFGPNKENNYHNTFDYDSIGNFTKKSLENKVIQPSTTATLPKETNYVLNYQYLTGGSTKPHAVTETDDKKYSYDSSGNMTGWTSKTNGTKRTITWSEENRVKQIEDNGKTTYFLYDDAGERVVKRGEHGETIYVNRFFSIRNGELGTKHVFAGETRVVSKLVKTPNTNTSNSGTTIPGSNGLDNGLGKKRGIIKRLPDGYTTAVNQPIEKDLFYFHGDHLGSSNMITDNDGAVYQHLEYFPYGETWIEEGGTYGGNTPGYKFTGKELDPETGLYYYGARYYDPVLSRWVSADPALGEFLPIGNKNRHLPGFGGVYNSLNLGLYGYGHQNPLKFTDPDGKEPYQGTRDLAGFTFGYGVHSFNMVVTDNPAKYGATHERKFQKFTNTSGNFPGIKKGNTFYAAVLSGDKADSKLVKRLDQEGDRLAIQEITGEQATPWYKSDLDLNLMRLSPGKGKSDFDLEKGMLDAFDKYNDQSSYSYVPSLTSWGKKQTYNSNSFTRTISERGGAQNAPTGFLGQLGRDPGTEKSISSDYFGKSLEPAACH